MKTFLGQSVFLCPAHIPRKHMRRIVGKGEVLRRGQSTETQSKINTWTITKLQSESAHKAGCAGRLPSSNKLNCPALTVTMASWMWSYMGEASAGGSQALSASRAGRETSSHGNSVQEQEVCVCMCCQHSWSSSP